MASPRRIILLLVALIVSACAALPALERPRVSFSDIDDVSFRGMELRLLLKLRVENPNPIAIDYDGVDVRLDIEGRTVARGLSAEKGSVPARGEAIVALPVAVSLMELGNHAMRIIQGRADRLRYSLEGRLDSPLFGATRFRREGELALPNVRLQ